MNLAKYLRTTFLQSSSRRLLLTKSIIIVIIVRKIRLLKFTRPKHNAYISWKKWVNNICISETFQLNKYIYWRTSDLGKQGNVTLAQETLFLHFLVEMREKVRCIYFLLVNDTKNAVNYFFYLHIKGNYIFEFS